MKLVACGLNGSYATITTKDGLLENVPVPVQPTATVFSSRIGQAALKEEMQVGLNAYALYKGFNDVQSVVIEKLVGDMSLFVVKTLDG
jgi:molybdopterin-containing oxidoreductase family iron-sulfur binding subunit